jgi:hypothetical protein
MPTAARLRVVRDRLLKLHKTLLDWERAQYEKAYGQVRSSGDMLQLVLGHDQFAWLRPYSGLIVRIDEWLVSDQPSRQDAEAFWEESDRLTTPGDTAESSQERYRAAIDSSPDAAIAHASVRDALSDTGY